MRPAKVALLLMFLPAFAACIILHSPGMREMPEPPWEEPLESRDAESFGAQEQLHAVLWMQTSVEYRAACLTAFDRARLALDAALSDPAWTAALEQRERGELPEKTAVVVDIDETILDNSPYQAELILDGRPFDADSWRKWILLGRAEAVPGALEFIRYAEGRGVTVFYVSNRDAETPGDRESPQESATRKNLEALGLALPVSEDTVLLKNEVRGWGSDKGSRRSLIAQAYRILLLVGDDLGDFLSDVRTSLEDRQSKADARRDMWGRGWIMLPNAMYGSWEGALSDYDGSLTPGEILEKKRSRLRGIE